MNEHEIESSSEQDTKNEFTARAIISGLGIGTLIAISNTYFGLQTGWISMMSLPASLLGYGTFKLLPGQLSAKENVLIQTVAVASGTMPLAAGLVGVIPALEKLLDPSEGSINLTTTDLIIWSAGVAFFGVFFTIPLRKQVLVRERLKFPSGTATAEMITVLHNASKDEIPYHVKIRYLLSAFTIASITTIVIFLFPSLRTLAVFDWITLYQYSLSATWLLNFQPSLAYIGQGWIMGLNTTSSMLLGTILGWCILSPLAKHHGWAPGPAGDYTDGARGWLIWISLAIMLSDSCVSLAVVLVKWVTTRYEVHENEEDVFPMRYTVCGLIGSTVLCISSIKLVFPEVPILLSLISIVLALFLAVLGVRALGETDLNPVSGIGKISQLLFAFMPRSSIIINLVAGGVAEAGAQQAGDLMQDLKTGQLIGASPRIQTYGQLIGSVWSVFISVWVYRLYTTIYTIPSDVFAIPTAYQWLDCARLVNGSGLPPKIPEFAGSLALLFALISLIKSQGYTCPSGLAVAVGIYNTPNFTFARFLGGVIGWYYTKRHPSRAVLGVIIASGFILGEGVLGSTVMVIVSLIRH